MKSGGAILVEVAIVGIEGELALIVVIELIENLLVCLGE